MSTTKQLLMESFLAPFDQNIPICLFCQSALYINSQTIANSPDVITTNIYSCIGCTETFYTYSRDNFGVLFGRSEEDPFYFDFRFSCNDLVLWYGDDPNYLLLGNNKKNIHWMKIPVFMANFSDKDKLYRKLKTYLLFS